MKKVISILILITMIMGVFTVVNAANNSNLADKLYEIGKPYGMTTANKVRIQRYLKNNPVSNEVADKLVEKGEEAAKVFEDANATRYSELSTSEKDEVKSIANEAASLLGLTLKFKTSCVEIYKNGKLIDVEKFDGNKLVYTGNEVNTGLVVSSVVAIALAAGFIVRKKFANA